MDLLQLITRVALTVVTVVTVVTVLLVSPLCAGSNDYLHSSDLEEIDLYQLNSEIPYQKRAVGTGKEVDLVLVLDGSGSNDHAHQKRWSTLLYFVKRLVKGVRTKNNLTRFGLITLNETATIRIKPVYPVPESLTRDILRTRVPGGNYSDFSKALEQLDGEGFGSNHCERQKSGVRLVSLYITNGDEKVNLSKIKEMKSKLKCAIHILGLGVESVGNDPDKMSVREQLSSIVTTPSEIQIVKTFEDLDPTHNKLVELIS